MVIWALLERLGATDEVVAHVREIEAGDGGTESDGLDRVWNQCGRADAAVWVAAQKGALVPDIVAAACACAGLACGDRARTGPIHDALAAADRCLGGEDAGPDCIEAAEACLALSESQTAGETYRGTADDAARWSALAAEWAARAAEGLATAAARYWALHAESARRTGALIGLPSFAVMGVTAPKGLRFRSDGDANEPEQDELAFVLAAAAESVAHSARALAAPADDAASIANAHAACVALMRRELRAA